MFRFVLTNCEEERIAVKIMQTLRLVHLEPLPGFKVEDCFTNQMLTVKNLKSSMIISKKVTHATITVAKCAEDEEGGKPIDLILILLLVSIGTTAKKSAETIFKQHLRSGYYRKRMLQTFYKDYLEVITRFKINLTLN